MKTEINTLKEMIQTPFREDLRTRPNTGERTLSLVAKESTQTRSNSDETVVEAGATLASLPLMSHLRVLCQLHCRTSFRVCQCHQRRSRLQTSVDSNLALRR